MKPKLDDTNADQPIPRRSALVRLWHIAAGTGVGSALGSNSAIEGDYTDVERDAFEYTAETLKGQNPDYLKGDMYIVLLKHGAFTQDASFEYAKKPEQSPADSFEQKIIETYEGKLEELSRLKREQKESRFNCGIIGGAAGAVIVGAGEILDARESKPKAKVNGTISHDEKLKDERELKR